MTESSPSSCCSINLNSPVVSSPRASPITIQQDHSIYALLESLDRLATCLPVAATLFLLISSKASPTRTRTLRTYARLRKRPSKLANALQTHVKNASPKSRGLVATATQECISTPNISFPMLCFVTLPNQTTSMKRLECVPDET